MAFFGSTDGNLYAVDLESGTQKWKLFTGVRVTSSPAVENGVVYFGSYSGRFYAVDAASGKLKWKFQTEGEKRFEARHLHGSEPAAETMPDPFDFYLSSPALWGGAVYFGSGDGNVYALDVATGTLKWKFKTGDVVHASPDDLGRNFVHWKLGQLLLRARCRPREKKSGASRPEKFTTSRPGRHSVLPQRSWTEWCTSAAATRISALDARTGEKKWAFNNKGSWVITSPAIHDGKVYFATSDTAMVYALDAKAGTPVFSLKFGNWPLFSSPAIAGGMLYIGSHQGTLIAIDFGQPETSLDI